MSCEGVFEEIAKILSIQLNGRDRILNRLKDYYVFSPFYIGKGNGFVHRFLIDYAQNSSSAHATTLHNDILRYYIDLGFIPSILFFLNLSYWNVNRLRKKFSVNSAYHYILLSILAVICWTTDNLTTYPNFLLIYNLALLSLIDFRVAYKSSGNKKYKIK